MAEEAKSRAFPMLHESGGIDVTKQPLAPNLLSVGRYSSLAKTRKK